MELWQKFIDVGKVHFLVQGQDVFRWLRGLWGVLIPFCVDQENMI
jgi:hypothetical protein